jgi:hypothetical protein
VIVSLVSESQLTEILMAESLIKIFEHILLIVMIPAFLYLVGIQSAGIQLLGIQAQCLYMRKEVWIIPIYFCP